MKSFAKKQHNLINISKNDQSGTFRVNITPVLYTSNCRTNDPVAGLKDEVSLGRQGALSEFRG